MPQVRVVDAVQHQVGQGDGVGQVVLLAPVEAVVLEHVELFGRYLATLAPHVFGRFGQEAARAAAGVAHRVADARVHRANHGTDQLARCVELAAVGVLLAHLQQQAFVHLGQHELVLGVGARQLERMHLVQHVGEVRFAVHPHPIDRGDDLADDLLLGRGASDVAQVAQVRQELAVDEREEGTPRAIEQFAPLPALRPTVGRPGRIGLVAERRGPVLPAPRRGQRRLVGKTQRLRLLALECLLFVQHSQKQDPGQLRNVAQRAADAGAAQHVANGPDGLVQGLWAGQCAGLLVATGLGNDGLRRRGGMVGDGSAGALLGTGHGAFSRLRRRRQPGCAEAVVRCRPGVRPVACARLRRRPAVHAACGRCGAVRRWAGR